ncbi:HalOD1 output domain-containing protein [Haloprofundus salilacus]|uniref:HalOD1 output domain-containing protein n=1 Tax=Haloprofundus salilacus TaxID=2876190 RepID=UPI001CCD55D4|nr:HalOD1 output domain-containing protein [Haloprofundus salilacus]
MEPSQENLADEITPSMSVIEFDVDEECFRATYDSTRDSTSLAVVEVVATALDRDPLELIPLQSIIETDVLDERTAKLSNGLGDCDCISFCYEEVDVTVRSEGIIEAAPTENT